MHAEPLLRDSEPSAGPSGSHDGGGPTHVIEPASPARGRVGWLRDWWPVIAAGAAWVGFGWAWIVIFLDRASSVSLGGPGLLGVYFVAMLTVTLVWRAHNRRLHARFGPRERVPRVRESWRVDHSGRVLRADWPRVRAARVVDVGVDGDVKTFETGEPT